MKKIDVSLRVDIDTVKDAELVLSVIQLLDEFEIPATFFITTGVDNTFKNFKNYLNPLRLLEKKQISRYGVRQILRGLISREHVQKTEQLRSLINSRHEVGLHGHDHYDWMNQLDNMDTEQIITHFESGIRLFEMEFGFLPRCFASPGFKANDLSLRVMEKFGFLYASDFISGETSFPVKGEETLQIPVTLPCFGDMETVHSDAEIQSIYINTLNSADDFFVFYIHPSYEAVFKLTMLKDILCFIRDSDRFNPVIMSEIAKHIGSGID